jgi:hypothetical protein
MDQDRSSVPEDQTSNRCIGKSDKVYRDDQKKRDRSAGQVDIIAMVRSLQRTAGLTDCFRTGIADCDIIDCDWRAYCLGTLPDQKKNGTPPKQK